MSRPTVKIHNVLTNEVIEREMNDAEFAQYEIDQIAFVTEQTKATQRQAIAERLGLSSEELNLLLGGK